MNDSEYNELREASWRRELSPAEQARVQAFLAANPQGQADWEEDLALTRQLQGLPDAALSSNFTSLVLQAAEAEATSRNPPAGLPSWGQGWLSRLLPRMALGLIMVALGLTGFFGYQRHTRKQIAGGWKAVELVANVPDPQVFEDFDAIRKLQPVSFSSDEDLVTALR
jgi:anti-sigma factor RsiW